MTITSMECLSKEKGKDKESIQSSATPESGHHMRRWQNTRKHNTPESQEVIPFPEGDYKVSRNTKDKREI